MSPFAQQILERYFDDVRSNEASYAEHRAQDYSPIEEHIFAVIWPVDAHEYNDRPEGWRDPAAAPTIGPLGTIYWQPPVGIGVAPWPAVAPCIYCHCVPCCCTTVPMWSAR